MTEVTGKTKVIGVWGHPVGHSRSPAMHNAALRKLGLNWVYVPFDVSPDQIPEAIAGIKALSLIGVNVTVPLKELVLSYAIASEAALLTGSVNTLYFQDGSLYGDSTDGRGFLRSLQDAGQSGEGRSALILGAGGSARAVAFALASLGSRCKISNRTAPRAEALVCDINRVFPGCAEVAGWGMEANKFDLLVNTTSLGMHPNEESLPVLPPEVFAARPFVYDLIYAPARTRLLSLAEQAGCQISNGITMLVHQGALSLSLWTGLPVEEMPVKSMEAAVRASL